MVHSFRKMIANFMRPTGNCTYKIFYWLDCGFSHLSRNTNLDITLLTHRICYVLVLWKLRLRFIFFRQFQNYTALLKAIVTELKNIDIFYFIMSLRHVSMYNGRKNFGNSMNVGILTETTNLSKTQGLINLFFKHY